VRLAERRALAVEQVAQRAALTELHLHIKDKRLLPRAVVLDDVGVGGHVIGELDLLEVLGALLARLELALQLLDRIPLVRPHLVLDGVHVAKRARAKLVQPAEVVLEREGVLRARRGAEGLGAPLATEVYFGGLDAAGSSEPAGIALKLGKVSQGLDKSNLRNSCANSTGSMTTRFTSSS